ncbi:Rha family transcriptional regulator [Pseudomonas sp. TNT2022 ID357]|uniref:Rha family transcriptional regulator n=1 Tax=Pseudomonas idahonensis TaxID=2942628 RepID=A0ABT5Q849_9PSED|nr:Rha family transcriptional regulator [Pseudomonas idahonensis]MDD1150379.1 Rha family transcriptional regulator [Pseudomonas idahonensis]
MTNLTITGSQAVTMSSVEIADLTGKLHKNVLADIRLMLTELEIDSAEFSAQYKDSTGRFLPCFKLDRELTETLITGYSIPLRNKVIRRLHEMEKRLRQTLPENLPDALRFAADLAEEKALLALENQQQAKKIEALEHLFMPGETVPQFAKRLNGVNSQLIMAFLIDQKWIFNAERDPERSVKYRVYYLAREKHWLSEKPVTVSGEGLKPFIRYAPVMLEEGTKKLFDLYMAEKLPMKKTWDGQFFYEKFNPEKPL